MQPADPAPTTIKSWCFVEIAVSSGAVEVGTIPEHIVTRSDRFFTIPRFDFHPTDYCKRIAKKSKRVPIIQINMFESIAQAPPDAILGLSESFAADPNPNKISLAVGVYKDASGQTPVLRCVKAAERKLVETEKTKTYLGIEGLPDYRHHVQELLFGDSIEATRVAVVQTPGGTGGVRVAADFVFSQHPRATVWISNPTWENHINIFAAAGLATHVYRYLDASRTGLDFDGMMEDLTNKASPGDVVLLHACCHNPTGIDPTPEQWQRIGSILAEKRLLPLVDFAYQGFGRGIQEDATGLRGLLRSCPEMLVASSFSKNFGLYSERVGAAVLVATDARAATAGLSQLKRVIRSNYSNPPRHGAAIVSTILADPDLRTMWHEELSQMRGRITEMRHLLVKSLRDGGAKRDFSFLLNQSGMFSYTGLTPMQVDRLRSEKGLYIVGSGRINVAGITENNLPSLTASLLSVL
jgi:aspartate aminotransferase